MAKILIVDDDVPTREGLAALLRLEGHEVVAHAANGRDALALLADGCRPDVILLDLHMPVMNGWDFLAALRENLVEPPPIVVLSGDANLSRCALPVASALTKGYIGTDSLTAAIRSAANRKD